MKYLQTLAFFVLLCAVVQTTQAQTPSGRTPGRHASALERLGMDRHAHRATPSAEVITATALRLDSMQTVFFERNGDTSSYSARAYDFWTGFHPQPTVTFFTEFEPLNFRYQQIYRDYEFGSIKRVDPPSRYTSLALPNGQRYEAWDEYDEGRNRLYTDRKIFTKTLTPTLSTVTEYNGYPDGTISLSRTTGIFVSMDRDTTVRTYVEWNDSTTQRSQPIERIQRTFVRDTPTEYIELAEYKDRDRDDREYYRFSKDAQGRLLSGIYLDDYGANYSEFYEYTYSPNTVTVRIRGVEGDKPTDTTDYLVVTVTDPATGAKDKTLYVGKEAQPERIGFTERVTFVDGLPLSLDYRENGLFDDVDYRFTERYFYSQVSGVAEARRPAEPCAVDVTQAGGTVEATVAAADIYALLDVTGRRVAEQRAGAGERISFHRPASGLYFLVGQRSACVSKVAVAP